MPSGLNLANLAGYPWAGDWNFGYDSTRRTTINPFERAIFMDPTAGVRAGYEAWRYPQSMTTPRGYERWLDNRMPDYQARYTTWGALNPNQEEAATTSFYEWLTGLGNQPMKEYQMLSPAERGSRPSVFAGRGRWVP